MLEYARWKYILVAVVLLLALLFALPNVFGEDPALQVERKDHSPVTQDAARAVESFLGERRVHFARSYIDGGRLMVRVVLPPEADGNAARTALNQPLTGLAITTESLPSGSAMTAVMTPAQIRERQDYAIQQNITTLRNRVNELGVSEPIVQRQGIDRINVQLPGVQNSAEVKDILGRVATLEFRLEDMQNNAFEAMQSGRAPLGSKLYTHTRFGRPVLRSEEHTSELQSLTNLVCRLL